MPSPAEQAGGGRAAGPLIPHPALRSPPSSPQLLCLEAVDETAGPLRHQVLALAKLQAQPRVIYAAARADADLLALLRAPLGAAAGVVGDSGGGGGGDTGEGEDGGGEGFEVRLDKSSLFAPQQVRRPLTGGWAERRRPPLPLVVVAVVVVVVVLR